MLDVNLGDKTDRIVLYRGDQDHLHEVAEEFARKHNLDEENKEQLLELLEVELNNVLEKIDEDEGDDYEGENWFWDAFLLSWLILIKFIDSYIDFMN